MEQTATPIETQTALQQAAVKERVEEQKDARLSVWLDADSCPRELRPVLLRAAARLNQNTHDAPNGEGTFVAFHLVAASAQCLAPFQKGALRGMYFHEVAPGPNAADGFIETHCQSGDMIITRDIAFAQSLCLKDSTLCIINDRGTEYTRENVFARCRQRNLALELRNADLLPENKRLGTNHRPAKYTGKKQFAACFDRCLTRQLRKVRRQNTGLNRPET